MVSKEFHASRRRLYAELMEDDSVTFVFAKTSCRTKGMNSTPSPRMRTFIISPGSTSRKRC